MKSLSKTFKSSLAIIPISVFILLSSASAGIALSPVATELQSEINTVTNQPQVAPAPADPEHENYSDPVEYPKDLTSEVYTDMPIVESTTAWKWTVAGVAISAIITLTLLFRHSLKNPPRTKR